MNETFDTGLSVNNSTSDLLAVNLNYTCRLQLFVSLHKTFIIIQYKNKKI